MGHAGYRLAVALTAITYAGLFAFISGSSFVLQGVYGLDPLAYGLSFAFVVCGYIAGTVIAQIVVPRRGLAGTIRLGTAALAVGGCAMLALVLAGPPSSLALTVPMALYGTGVGLTMPQAVASAMQPFPDRAGAASSLLGIVQMSLAALVGIGVGWAIAFTPIALPAAIAALGLAALALQIGLREKT